MGTDRNDHPEKQKVKRAIVSRRLRLFFEQVKGMAEMDSEDFFRRVLEQANKNSSAHFGQTAHRA